MQAIIQLTDKPEEKNIDIAVGLDSEQINLASPAHVIAVWIVNNFQKIVEQASNDRAQIIRTVTESEDTDVGGAGGDIAQKPALN